MAWSSRSHTARIYNYPQRNILKLWLNNIRINFLRAEEWNILFINITYYTGYYMRKDNIVSPGGYLLFPNIRNAMLKIQFGNYLC